MDTFTFFDRLPIAFRTPSWRRTQFARRLLAVFLLIIAALLYVTQQLSPHHSYVVLARDVSPGTIVTADHLTTVSLRDDVSFQSRVNSASDVVGRVVATPLRSGDFLQHHHLLGPELTAAFGDENTTLVPVKLADPAAAELAIPGATVSVVAAHPRGEATTIAHGARVVFGTSRKTDSTEAGTVLLAMDPRSAESVAAASLGAALTVVLTPASPSASPPNV